MTREPITDDPPYPAYTAGTSPNWSLLPYHMRGGLRRYIERGIPPGSFMTAVISNDLYRAVSCADEHNENALPKWIRFLYNYCPIGSWGSPENFKEWIASGGLEGQQKRAEESVAAQDSTE